MIISKLYIFSKNTDANASIRGYNYQTLKTLETWLENLLNKIDEDIYCDFEEDIFQKNNILGTAKFRQLKLYSSNFSFKSEEIEKCISHFFMLHIKTDYREIDKEFIFETNTKVAGKYKENDAELLRNWVSNQNDLSEGLLKSCTDKVTSIVSKYIHDQEKELKDKVDAATIKEAIMIFEGLAENDWKDFTKKIKWKFSDIEPDEEFSLTISNIESLILKLPYNIEKNNLDATFGILYKTVSLKASEEKPENRKLTLIEIENLVIGSGSTDDKWYIEIYEKWKDIEKVEVFNIGEFYEIINAVRYCRRNKYLSSHDTKWVDILSSYILMNLPKEFEREAIYDYLWLRLRVDDNNEPPKGDLFGCEELVRSYFANFSEFKNANALEDAQSLLSILFTVVRIDRIAINLVELNGWFDELFDEINRQKNNTSNPNEKCHLLEELGSLALFSNLIDKKQRKPSEIIKYYEEILSIIDTAEFYHATYLSSRINGFINIFIKFKPEENKEVIKALEIFSKKLDIVVEKRDGQFVRAKNQVERGASYIYSNNPTLIIFALNHFHNAKDLWHTKETIDGYVLALINISQVYSAIGFNFAAKYYALAGVWASLYNGDKRIYKRIADSLGMVFYSDFSQGSWLNSITDFHLFINSRNEFNPTSFNPEEETLVMKAIADFAIILYATPKISPQFQILIDTNLQFANYQGLDVLNSLLEMMEKKWQLESSLNEFCENLLNDFPLNDSGRIRKISFYALGSLWEISFDNNYQINSIAEEFIAILQIILSEISLSELDFHFIKGKIKLELEIADQVLSPEQLPSNTEYKWKVFIYYLDNAEPENINKHMGKNSMSVYNILNEISLLKDSEFGDLFKILFEQNGLASKTLSENAYQRIYRKIFSNGEFDVLQREHFLPVNIDWSLPTENNLMKWNHSLSPKYNFDASIKNIHNRFINSYHNIHITLEKLLIIPEFHDYINELRNEGFLDWQIIIAIWNFILNYKANLDMKNIVFENEEKTIEALQNGMDKYSNLDEEDCYIYFPLEAFKSDDFNFQLKQIPIIVLKSIGLENKSRFPNFDPIMEFLNIRFNMKNDFNNLDNPLTVIKRE